MIPGTIPRGVNRAVIPPAIPKSLIEGKYFWKFFWNLEEINPPLRYLRVPPSPSSSSISSLPKSFCLRNSLCLIRPKPTPAAAPKIGPPIIPVIRDTPPPSRPSAIRSAALGDTSSITFLVVSLILLVSIPSSASRM